jgi:hypothetical protein
MKISKEKLDDLFFTLSLSSGSDVVICYDQSSESLYGALSNKKNINDIEIIRFLIPYDLPKGKNTKNRLKKAIEEFIPPKELRDRKINDIIN